MRTKACLILALILALPAFSARAEGGLTLSRDALTLGGQTEIRVEMPGAVEYAYAATLNGETVFEGEFVPHASGWFRPREAGEYTISVTARDEAGQTRTAEATLQVAGKFLCQAALSQDTVTAGGTVDITLSGQAGDCLFGCSVYLGNERIAHMTGDEPTFSYTPAQAGDMRIVGEIDDGQGNRAESDPVALTVLPGPGIGVTGETGAVPAQGGYRIWTVHAPGVWTAETDSDFILLGTACGAPEDPLSLQVLPIENGARQGSVTIVSGDLTAEISVAQREDSNEAEEEISFEPAADYVAADGRDWAAWQDAMGEKTFSVAASGEWQAACDADFLTVTPHKNTLTVAAEANESGAAREAVIELTCGEESAKIYVSQPGQRPGADVLDVTLSADHGTAYQDMIIARVLTTRETERLTLSFDGAREPVVFARDAAEEGADGLWWQADILLSGAGRQRWLFAAENAGGRGTPALKEIDVTPEAPALVPDGAVLERGERENHLILRTTRTADTVTLLDAAGGSLGDYAARDAIIDRCADPEGRYIDWEITLPPETLPAGAALGGVTVPIAQRAAENGFTLYSQQDGWWLDKQYRHSNLQQSGCAIFALSHALQLLGYTDDRILPENLAITYASCLMEGGTVNDALVGRAGDDLGFKTRYELYENLNEIVKKMEEQGAVFSFSVVSGHIAMVAAVSPDHTKFRIIDSAPSATFERIKGGQLYIETEAGFRPIASLDEIPGIRYYVESNGYGGAEYWLDASYVAKRGVRLIQPAAK